MKHIRTEVKEVCEFTCDICGSNMYQSEQKCPFCGKDVCDKCIRLVCRRSEADSPRSTFDPWAIQNSNPQFLVEGRICVSCMDALKLSLRISAGSKE